MGQSGLLASKEITKILICSGILSSASKLEFHVIPIFTDISHTWAATFIIPFLYFPHFIQSDIIAIILLLH